MNDTKITDLYKQISGHTVYESDNAELNKFMGYIFESLTTRNRYSQIFSDKNFSFMYRRDGKFGGNKHEDMLIYLIADRNSAVLHAKLYPDINADIEIDTKLAQSFNDIAYAKYPEHAEYAEYYDGYMSYFYTKSCIHMWEVGCPEELLPINDMLREIFNIVAEYTNTLPHNIY